MANRMGAANSANSAGDAIAGVGGAIPFLNIIAPGLSQQFANAADRDRRTAAIEEMMGVALPSFGNEGYKGPEYAGDFNPELHSDPVAAKYELVTEDPRLRGLQMQALQRMQQFSDQAADSQEALGRYNAVSDGNALAAQRENAIRNQMAMRGQGGSGAEFVMSQVGAQEGANRAAGAGLNAAAMAALQRLAGGQAAFGAASGMRGQDLGVAGQNAGIINAFNMRNTDALNAARAANVGLKNAGALRNLDARQGFMNNRTGIGNANVDRGDRNAMAGFGASMQKHGSIADLITGAANAAQKGQLASREAGKEGYENLQSIFRGGAPG